jgi:hypothetical protein
MTTSIWIDLPYHQQDKSYYCGAAVAQMMSATPDTCPPQAKLYHRLNGEGWYTAPDLLATLLRKRLHRGFAVWHEARSAAACEQLARALIAARSAVAAVVMNGQHWVAVTGVAGASTATGDIAGIDGFYFCDPAPVTAHLLDREMLCPPLPHRTADACGRGGCYGFANTYATIGGWLTEYWPPQPGPYITVADTPLTLPVPLKLGERRPCAAVMPRPEPISKDEAMACATVLIAESGIVRHGPLARYLDGSRATAARYVAGDATTAPYYLVFLQAANGKLVGTATVDAGDGALCTVQAAQTGTPPPAMERAEIAHALRAYAELWPDFDCFRHVREADVVVDDALYWRPCRESVSRHRPFVRIEIDGETLYRELHGRFYRKLEPAAA